MGLIKLGMSLKDYFQVRQAERRVLRAQRHAPERLTCRLSEGLARALVSYIML